MTVKEIIKRYAKEIGATGLCNPNWDCGCNLEEFSHCLCDFSGCQLAILTKKGNIDYYKRIEND